MRLNPGDRLAHYQIVAMIGQGGMGEVYRATDTRLPREVAIKTSAEQFSERFAREVHAIASLNHPNICTLHDVGPDYLVMEMIEGPTLAERIKDGPVSLAEARAIMRQVADALDYAHEKGVIHRDLKPANIKIRPDGLVKVLDFGLAKISSAPDTPASGAEDATVTMGATQVGMVLGTAAYMSPEQAMGKPVDKRADVWAFGVVFYELLTGTRLHRGDSMHEVVAAVLRDPPDLTQVPAQAHRLLTRCLEKDPNQRLRHVGDVMALLDESPSGVGMAPAAPAAVPKRWIWPVAVAGTLVAAAAIGLTFIPRAAPVLQEVRTQILQPDGLTFNPGTQATISPDGHWLAFPALGPDNVARMYIRALDSLETKPLPGSEGIRAFSPPPFWSYDSRLVVYATEDGTLKTSDIALTPARSIAELGVPFLQGGSWSRDGVILFANGGSSVMRLPAQGGTPVHVTMRARDERAHRYPQFLPDGKRFLYLRNWSVEKTGIYVGSINRKPEEQDTQPLLLTDRQAMWVESPVTGKTYLLSQRGTNLVAQDFNPDTLKLSGTPVTVATEVGSFAGASAGLWSIAATGTLMYRSGGQGQDQILWRDAAGASQGVVGGTGDYQTAVLSPDGGKLAYRAADAAGNFDIWVRDLVKNTVTRLSFDPGRDANPVWSPDGQRIVFVGLRNGGLGLHEVSLAKPGEERLLFSSADEVVPSSWSRDGLLLFTRYAGTVETLWVLPVNGSAQPCALRQPQFPEEEAMVSPNGRWIAYMGRPKGDQQVFVRSFSPEKPCDAGSEKVISFGGGMHPRWSAAGDRLFFSDLNGNVMAVHVQTGDTFQQDGAPRRLFGGISTSRTFFAAPKGDRFLVVEAASSNGPPPPFTMVQNWLGKLKE